METISNGALEGVHGGDVDYSMQRHWQALRFLSFRRNGPALFSGSKGLATPNGNFTPNVIPLFQ